MENTNLTPEQISKLNYDGELTLEALATLDTYIKSCCNITTTAHKLRKGYMQVRRYLKQPFVREIFQLKLLEKGVTPEKVADVIKSGLDAENGIYYEGQEVGQEPNWMARQKFVQLAAEIFEVLKYNNKTDIFDNSKHLHITTVKQAIEYAYNNGNGHARDKAASDISGAEKLEG